MTQNDPRMTHNSKDLTLLNARSSCLYLLTYTTKIHLDHSDVGNINFVDRMVKLKRRQDGRLNNDKNEKSREKSSHKYKDSWNFI